MSKNYIFKIDYTKVNCGNYKSAMVIAPNETEAKEMTPCVHCKLFTANTQCDFSKITVEKIGITQCMDKDILSISPKL